MTLLLSIHLPIRKISLLATLLPSLCCTSIYTNENAAMSTVMSSDEIEWGYLNPLGGDKSPGAADLWGDRTKNVATGMLLKFNKGFLLRLIFIIFHTTVL